MNKDIVAEDVTFPPQSSVEVESHGKEGQRYYTWKVKVYCDNLDFALSEVGRMHKLLKAQFGATE